MLVFGQAVFSSPPRPQPSLPIFLLSPVFSFEPVQHGARNRIRLIELSAFSQDRPPATQAMYVRRAQKVLTRSS